MMEKAITTHGSEPNPLDTTGLCLLSLDGGGVRGLSTLYILKSIMDRLNHERKTSGLPPVKPCEVFDLIGGTSTGGLIAIMLGRLEMDVDQCISAYSGLAEAVFGEKQGSIPMTITGNVKARFDSAKLENAIREVVKQSGASEEDMFNNNIERGCKTFVCTADRYTKNIVRLRSYSLPDEPNVAATICQAALATSAATTFFDPVSIGNRSFADGGLGANNPVDELEGEASNIWCSETRDLRPLVKCFISIGTGNPGIRPFENKLFKFLGRTIVQIATETENTERRFIARWARHFDEKRYFRFNVEHGLQDIGLDEYNKRGVIEAATEGYLTHMTQRLRVRDCIQNMKLKQNKTDMSFPDCMNGYIRSVQRQPDRDKYQIPFSLKGVPTGRFVERPEETRRIEQSLLPHLQKGLKVLVLNGLGGIGKTQLAVQFARKHQASFTSVFWIDGSSEESAKQSISDCASRIPETEFPEGRRRSLHNGQVDYEQVVHDFLGWLSNAENTQWLLIFDNVDSDYQQGTETAAYDISNYLPEADHGSILITTRLTNLQYLGESLDITSVNISEAQAIFQKWYSKDFVLSESLELLQLLDGLPLALIQAAGYMNETGMSFSAYIRLYKEQLADLLKSDETVVVRNCGNCSIYTTWSVSYKTIHAKNEGAANLLLLWAHLNNKSLQYWVFQNGVKTPGALAEGLLTWLKGAANNAVKFSATVRLLRNYGLVESLPENSAYYIHPEVHQWAFHIQDGYQRAALSYLAVCLIGNAIPDKHTQGYHEIQRQLLPHAESWMEKIGGEIESDEEISNSLYLIGMLLYDRGKPLDAEKMYKRALESKEKALGPDHLSTLETAGNLGVFYVRQGKLAEAEKMFQRALEGCEKAFGPDHASTLSIINNLGVLYTNQGKLADAEKMYQCVLEGEENALGPDHLSTLKTVNNLGLLYDDQGKLAEAEKMYQRALKGEENALGPDHPSGFNTLENLGNLYTKQGKLAEAEEIYQRVFEGKKRAWGSNHLSTLDTVNNLGALYYCQGKLVEAEKMYQRVLEGREKAWGPNHPSTLSVINNLGLLYNKQGKLVRAEKMFQRVLEGRENVFGPNHPSVIESIKNLGNLYAYQGKRAEAEKVYQRALDG